MPKTAKKRKKKEVESVKTLVLFDAHAVIHRAYHALPDFSSSKGEPTGALYGLSAMLIKIIGELKPAFMAACYDLPGATYRHDAYENYKVGRKKADDELVNQLERSKEIFKAFSIPIYSAPGFEADDVLGTIAEKFKNDKNLRIIIASGDMDTLQLVDNKKVMVYTLKKGISDTVLYDEDKVKERYGFEPALLPDFKGLRGDPSDNIIGIKGIGEKTATSLITTFGTIENIYKVLKKNPEKLKEAGLTDRLVKLLEEGEEEALFSKMLATIRRDAPVDCELPKEEWNKNVKLADIEELFRVLEFRTLGARFKEMLHQKLALEEEKISSEEKEEKKPEVRKEINVSKVELEETALALWIIDSNKTNPGLEEILSYARTADFEQAKETIFKELKERKLEKIFEEIEKPLLPVVAKMEERGVKVDKKYLAKIALDYHEKLSRLEHKIWKAAGEEFNVNSPKQLGTILFDKLGFTVKRKKNTPSGARSTREEVLLELAEEHEIVRDVLEYRELQKLLSTYIDNIPPLLDKNDRLHTNLILSGAATGRMASQNPNLQNIPIKTELGRNIRRAFISEKDFELVSIDYSQIELRIAAFLSGDEKLIEIFRREDDVHTAVAAQMFAVPQNKVDKEMRRRAKTINFGVLFGMGVNALRANLGTSRAEAQEFYNTYFYTFTGLAKYMEEQKRRAAKIGYSETFFGRRRYFSGLNSKLPYIRAAAERMAFNAPIQGTEADVIKIAMKRIDDFLVKEKLGSEVYMLLQVHDELLFEMKPRVIEEVVPEIKKIMEGVIPPEETSGIVLRAQAARGENWNDLQDM